MNGLDTVGETRLIHTHDMQLAGEIHAGCNGRQIHITRRIIASSKGLNSIVKRQAVLLRKCSE